MVTQEYAHKLFAYTSCASCGLGFDENWTWGAYVQDEKTGLIYPVCHPQDCRPPTEEEKAAWDVRYERVKV